MLMDSHSNELKATFWYFLRAVKSHWITLMSGGVITVALGLFERFSSRNVPLWVYAAVLIFFTFLACYLAWQDARNAQLKAERELEKVIADKETRKREWLIERLTELIREYSENNMDGWMTVAPENIGALAQAKSLRERLKYFIAEHWGDSVLEDFRARGTVVLEELLSKLMKMN